MEIKWCFSSGRSLISLSVLKTSTLQKHKLNALIFFGELHTSNLALELRVGKDRV